MNNLEGYLELQKKIEYEFKNRNLVITALSHSSFANEVRFKGTPDYERIEFLGDAVLELTVSEYLYNNRPDLKEGDMTKLRASLVCEPTLAYIARKSLDLPQYILLGKGEDANGGRNRDSIVSDVFEALLGAIYLDAGFEKAREFVRRLVLTDMTDNIEFSDSKTILQEYVQDKGLQLEYETVEEQGPEHDRIYVVRATVSDGMEAIGKAHSKKSAQQHAAFEILKKLHIEKGI